MEKVVCTVCHESPTWASRGELGVACAQYPLPAFSPSPPDSPSPPCMKRFRRRPTRPMLFTPMLQPSREC